MSMVQDQMPDDFSAVLMDFGETITVLDVGSAAPRIIQGIIARRSERPGDLNAKKSLVFDVEIEVLNDPVNGIDPNGQVIGGSRVTLSPLSPKGPLKTLTVRQRLNSDFGALRFGLS